MGLWTPSGPGRNEAALGEVGVRVKPFARLARKIKHKYGVEVLFDHDQEIRQVQVAFKPCTPRATQAFKSATDGDNPKALGVGVLYGPDDDLGDVVQACLMQGVECLDEIGLA